MNDALLSRCRVVLIRPQFAGNVGATARIMRNMGLSDLALVEPTADLNDRQARKLSTHGESILDRARICTTFDEAVDDCVLIAGTSARKGGLVRRQSVGLPEEIAECLLDGAASGPVALVLGPERTGLTDAEVTRCHHLIHIPTSSDYPALNLAQAVAICLYELRRASLRRASDSPLSPAEPVAVFAEQDRMFDQLRTALEEIHFLYGEKAVSLFHGLRHLIGRARPTAMEVGLLTGLARQIRWHVRNAPSAPPDAV